MNKRQIKDLENQNLILENEKKFFVDESKIKGVLLTERDINISNQEKKIKDLDSQVFNLEIKLLIFKIILFILSIYLIVDMVWAN